MAAVVAVLNVPMHATLSGANRKSYLVPAGTHEIHLYTTVAGVKYDLTASETDPDGTAPPADAYFTRPIGEVDPEIKVGPTTRMRILQADPFPYYFSVAGNTAVVEVCFIGAGGL